MIFLPGVLTQQKPTEEKLLQEDENLLLTEEGEFIELEDETP